MGAKIGASLTTFKSLLVVDAVVDAVREGVAERAAAVASPFLLGEDPEYGLKIIIKIHSRE